MHLVSERNKNIFLVNFFNESGHRLSESGWVDPTKKLDRVTGQLVFASSQKNQVRVRYFLGRVELGQKIMTRIAMFCYSELLEMATHSGAAQHNLEPKVKNLYGPFICKY